MINQPEPGRDIFGEKAKDIKSQAPVEPPVEAPVEEKVISLVDTQSAAPTAEIEQPKKEDVKSAPGDSSTDGTTAEKKTGEEEKSADASTVKPLEDAKPKPLAGPLGEEDAEADKVAKELYGDDVD